MQVPDVLRKCVAFVGYRKANGDHYTCGTAFFVGVHLTFDRIASYVVTARHVVVEAAKRSTDEQTILLRMNMKEGEAQYIETKLDLWTFHENGSDIAVSPVVISDAMDHRILEEGMIATSELIASEGVGPGDDVFLAGLFTKHQGEKKNIPIIRVGNIAAMPEEPLRTKLGYMDGYLVEARSVGGHSGSPVFVSLGGLRVAPDGNTTLGTGRKFYLLGVMHGHWDMPTIDVEHPSEDFGEREQLNSGIAVVVPAARISEVLAMPRFESMRAAQKRYLKLQEAPVLDVPKSGEGVDDSEFFKM